MPEQYKKLLEQNKELLAERALHLKMIELMAEEICIQEFSNYNNDEEKLLISDYRVQAIKELGEK